MPKAIHHGSTLALNPSNHPSIPQDGLVLVADTAIAVTAEQAAFLADHPNVTVLRDPAPSRTLPVPPSTSTPKDKE